MKKMEKRRESGPLAEKWQDRESKTTRHKKKRGERKGESNYIPEIPDKGMTSNIPGHPLGVKQNKRKQTLDLLGCIRATEIGCVFLNANYYLFHWR